MRERAFKNHTHERNRMKYRIQFQEQDDKMLKRSRSNAMVGKQNARQHLSFTPSNSDCFDNRVPIQITQIENNVSVRLDIANNC